MSGDDAVDWTNIVIGGLSLFGTLAGAYLSNRKSAILIAYRIEQLEDKVNKHNNFAARMPVVEEQIKVINHRINDLEKGE